MNTKYLVTEIQRTESAISTPSWAYDRRESAEAKFYTLCAAAVVSQVPVHTIMLFTDEGFMIDYKSFRHDPEPEEA